MSGGVDSSAAAALLLEQGYDVVGITLKLWPQDCVNRAEDKCCGPQAVTDARSVAHKLDIPYYLVDEAEDFQKQVINYFAEEYKAGRTPNPCVMCNEKLKFGTLISRARQLGRGIHRHRPFRARGKERRRPDAAQARARRAQGPELFSVFAAAGATGADAVSAGRIDEDATRAAWRGRTSSRPPTRRRAWKSASCRTRITGGFCSRRSWWRSIAAKS